MNMVRALPEGGLEKNLCNNCGSPLHLHVCAICQTVTSCRHCSEPSHVPQQLNDFTFPKIGPDRVVFRMGRLNRFHGSVRVGNAAARNSQPPHLKEPSRLVSRSNDSAEIAAGTRKEAPAPVIEGMRLRIAAIPETSKKWHSTVLLILVSGVAVAGYYAITPAFEMPTLSAMIKAVTGTGVVAPVAVRERLGEITQKPQLVNSGAQPLKTGFTPAQGTASITEWKPVLPAQGKEIAKAQPADEVAVAAAAPAPLPVETERPRLRPRVVRADNGSQAGPTSSGTSDVALSQAGGDHATPNCPTASQALGLCDARSK
ncbi:MAG: hypothetical protein JWM42_1665 [Burkholderia sp.]|nr:hypothetical protein [Burkholderia sp.]